MITLHCYLLRDDGQWYYLGTRPEWRSSFAAFPGPDDGSLRLWTTEDTEVLALRLSDGIGLAYARLVAHDIVRWADGHFMRFVSELDPAVELDVEPNPITGAIGNVQPPSIVERLAAQESCPICEYDPSRLIHVHWEPVD